MAIDGFIASGGPHGQVAGRRRCAISGRRRAGAMVRLRAKAAVCLAALVGAAFAQAPAAAGDPVPVTVDNFVRAESDLYMGRHFVKDNGGELGKFNHRREAASVDHQTVIRLNRDTLYSSACSTSTPAR